MSLDPEGRRLRAFTAGLGTESNTFIGRPIGLAEFESAFLHRPGEFPDRLTEISAPLYVLRERARAGEIVLVEGTYAFAFPDGRVEAGTYEFLRDEILAQLASALPVDFVVLSLHGAMCSANNDDCEGDLLQRVRQLVGPNVPIGVEFDLHAHLSEAMVAAADVLIAFKEYPHSDFLERAREVVALVDRCARTGWRPAKHVFDCRMLARFHTTRQPMRGLVDWVRKLEREPGIVSISIVHGFPFGDVADAGVKVLALAETGSIARAVAALVGEKVVSIRDRGKAPTVDLGTAIARVQATAHAPIVIADVDDNPGSGAPANDWSLASMLIDAEIDSCVGPLHDPELVDRAYRIGIGGRCAVTLRGVGIPVDRNADSLVLGLAEDAWQTWSDTRMPLGKSCSLRIGHVTVVVCSVRDQAYGPDLFTALAVDPFAARVIAVKSAQHFSNGFASHAADVIYAHGGGPLRSDLRRLPYRNVRRPLWPIDGGMQRRLLGEWVSHWALDRPSALAVVDEKVRLTWAELAAEVDRWSAALIAAGVLPGDRVAMLGVPGAKFLEAFLASASVGAVWVGLNPRYTESELDRVIDKVSPRLVFAEEFVGTSVFSEWMQRISGRLKVVAFSGAGKKTVVALGDFLEAGRAIDVETVNRCRGSVDPAAPCMIVFTSGSTGTPKGALISQWAITGASEVQVNEWGADPLRVLINLPINHIGCVGDLSSFAIVGGGTLVFMPRFDPVGLPDVVRDEKITVLGQVPSMFTMMLDAPGFDAAKLQSLRLIFWGGAHAPSGLIQRLRRLTGWLATSYGQTETVGSVTFTPRDATEPDLAHTVGHPVAPYLVRIKPLEGEGMEGMGEVEVQSPFCFSGYFGDPTATDRVFTADGWLRTGDIGAIDESGALRLTGRVHRVFKSGGYNVSPIEVEEALLEFPEISDVCVVGVDDALWGKVPVAFVVTSRVDQDPDVLRDRLRRVLANYKVPKRMIFLDSMPRLAIGKIDTQALLSMISG